MSDIPKIYISYRRGDASGYARLIYERLRESQPDFDLFMDVEAIQIGADWRSMLAKRIESADTVLVLIGHQWLTLTDIDGRRRLDDLDDLVRWEISEALRGEKQVIPVLLEGAGFPEKDALPEPLQPLADRQAFVVHHDTFDADLENLNDRLQYDNLRQRIELAQLSPLERVRRWLVLLLSSDRKKIKATASVTADTGKKEQRRFRFAFSIDWRQLFRVSLIAVVAIAAVAGSITTARIGISEMGVTRALSNAAQPCTYVPGEGPQMVIIPAGVFTMGSSAGDANARPDEFPAHNVSISKDFAIGRCEVTYEAFAHFTESTGREFPPDKGWGRGRRPVTYVTWQEAVAYADWLSNQTGKRYRLPTEAEWEYVARAGTPTDYWWGDDIRQDGQVWANCDGCGSQWDNRQTSPVGSFVPNAFGVYDTAGNVHEWVQDCWHDNYQGAPVDGSARLEADSGDCARRVIRGGSWYNTPRYLRSAIRFRSYPDERDNYLGFRLAQDL